MRRHPLVSTVLCLLTVLFAEVRVGRAADWPTWRHDSSRSGFTSESLPAKLALHWHRQLPVPASAWPEQQSKVQFDVSYTPVAAGGRLFVPSMVDDTLTAYDLSKGDELWRFWAEGPIRFAPLACGDRVFVVSDDGHLYCVAASSGKLLWKFRGGPTDQRVLGNERLISMWPARGAPVADQDTVYFAAGIWPFMGVFLHALDIETGEVRWTNSGSGSSYTVQQHNSPAFAGVAPQGYLALSGNVLLVSGGNTVPAAYDRQTGRLLYFRPSDRQLGNDAGGFAVVAGADWFANGDRLYRSLDGLPLTRLAVVVSSPAGVVAVSGQHLSRHASRLSPTEITTRSRKGGTRKTTAPRLPEVWRAELPEDVHNIHLQAGHCLVASDRESHLSVLRIPDTAGETCTVQWRTQLEGRVWDVIVADQNLVVVTVEGGIFCFGAAGHDAAGNDTERQATRTKTAAGQSATTGDQRRDERIAEWLQATPARDGYAVLAQADDISVAIALARQTRFHVIALQRDAQRCASWRRRLNEEGVAPSRVAVIAGDLSPGQLPPYMAELLVVFPAALPKSPAPPDIARAATRMLHPLRPYSGTAVVAVPSADQPAWVAAFQKAGEGHGEVQGRNVVFRRTGPLPGAGQWTHQNGDAGNTLVSRDQRVKLPLGLLWFGGPSNRDVLPRHGHGPTPQVIGGRLIIEGQDMLRALDVYTGRLLWQRPFEDVGIFFDTTSHRAGAGAVGGNYACTADSIYLRWGRRCLRLDPRDGHTLATFYLPSDASGERPYWGFLAVQGDLLVAGSSPLVRVTPGPLPVPSDGIYTRFGEGSQRLVVLDRFQGKPLWHRDARYNFRHNAIAIGRNRLFCLDRMTEKRLAELQRRGRTPQGSPALYALDLRSGAVAWQSDVAFGTWLAYSTQADVVLQAGSRNRDRAPDEVGSGLAVMEGATGKLLWRRDDAYAGPPLLYPDRVITQGTAYDLTTGREMTRRHPLTGEAVPWRFTRNYGCNTAVGCTHMLTFRSAAAGYYDLAREGGTGNFGGFRSSCTANLIAADGVLNAPDYTRTCTCSYQVRCSLALVPMPQVEQWTFSPLPAGSRRVERLGINFGAPGDRQSDSGTLWLDFPSVGGPSPDVPVTIEGDSVAYFRRHASAVADQPRWIYASGVTGANTVRIKLADQAKAGAGQVAYRVRLFFHGREPVGSDRPALKIQLQGQTRESPVVRASHGTRPHGFTREFANVLVGEYLELSWHSGDPGPAAASDPALCGIEVVRQSPDRRDSVD